MRNTPSVTMVTIALSWAVMLPNCASPRTAKCGNTATTHDTPGFAAGDVATFPEAALVKVRNLEPIEATTGRFEFENECLALDGGRVTVAAQYASRVLVRYEPPKKKFYGVCPSGTLFFVEATDLAKMDERYRANQAQLDSERKLVERLLKP